MAIQEKYFDDLESASSSSSQDISVLNLDSNQESEDFRISQNTTSCCSSGSSIPWAVKYAFGSVLYVLVPSFLRVKPTPKIYPTSYLDGLRGVAAFIVYIDHFAVNWFDLLRRGYGSTYLDNYVIQLPIIRLFYSGRASVAVFFVISGFVLSYKPLKQIHTGQHASLLDTLSCSVFRRSLRLYLPVAVGTFLSMLMAHWGWYQELPETSTDALPPALEDFSEHLQYWKNHMVGISWPFQEPLPNTPYSPPYNGHLWTIPIEFYGSMVVFLMVLCFCRCRTWIRFCSIGFISLCCLHYERWDLFLFLSGILLAEMSLLKFGLASFHHKFSAFEKGSCLAGISTSLETMSGFFPSMNYLLCFMSLYLLSYAGGSYPDVEPGPGVWHEFLMYWTGARYIEMWYGFERYWISIGGVILVFTISNSATLQRPFITRVAQYLGNISYALYIIHGPILFTFGSWFMNTYADQEDNRRYAWSFVVATLLNTTLCIWAADLFWRGVDAKSVSFAKWFAEKCWMKD